MTIAQYATEKWPQWFGGPAPRLRPVVLSGGPAHRDRCIIFLFPGPAKRPAVVLKIAFSEPESRFLSKEFRALRAVWAAVPPALEETIPRALGFERRNGTTVMATSALDGRRLLVANLAGRRSHSGARMTRDYFARAFAWSGQLARAAAGSSPAAEQKLQELTDRFLHAMPASGKEAERVRSFGLAVGRSTIRWTPTWQHRDVSVGNVLTRSKQLRFLDWEHASSGAEPWFDVAYAPGTTALLAQRQGRFPSVQHAAAAVLGRGHWVGALLRDQMKEVWSYPLPLGWGVALTSMSTALRRRQDGRVGWTDWGQFALGLLTDGKYRDEVDWMAPQW